MDASTDPVDSKANLSKKQLKRLANHEKWLEMRKTKRIEEKEKKKKRKTEKPQCTTICGLTRKQTKMNTMAQSKCRIRVAIDLSFEHLMNDRDLRKTLKQIQNCYATNRRIEEPLQFYLTSFGGKIQTQMESTQGNMKWDIHLNEKHYSEIFDKSQIIYLTSESPNELDQLEEQHVYIIGGLIDHNQHKGICYKLATELGCGHARLPIDQYVNMNSRRVLAINHVFQILAKWTESKCWKNVLLQVLPDRKNATPKE